MCHKAEYEGNTLQCKSTRETRQHVQTDRENVKERKSPQRESDKVHERNE